MPKAESWLREGRGRKGKGNEGKGKAAKYLECAGVYAEAGQLPAEFPTSLIADMELWLGATYCLFKEIAASLILTTPTAHQYFQRHTSDETLKISKIALESLHSIK